MKLKSTIKRLGIECDYRRTGDIDMATEPYQVDEMREELDIAAPYQTNFQFLNREQVQAVVKSPIFIAGIKRPATHRSINPAQLAWGLRKACLDLGVQLYEHSPVIKLVEENK